MKKSEESDQRTDASGPTDAPPSNLQFDVGDHAIVDSADSTECDEAISGEIIDVKPDKGGLITIRDCTGNSGQRSGGQHDVPPESITYSFNIVDTALAVEFDPSQGNEMPGHDRWAVTEVRPNRVCFESTGHIAIAIEQVKPTGYRQPFRVRALISDDRVDHVASSHFFDEALQLAMVYSKGVSETTGIDF